MTDEKVLVETIKVGEFVCPKCSQKLQVNHLERSDGKHSHRLSKS